MLEIFAAVAVVGLVGPVVVVAEAEMPERYFVTERFATGSFANTRRELNLSVAARNRLQNSNRN